jgi:hypothetical protein
MPAYLRSGLVLAVAVTVALGISALPGRAEDESKALRKRIRQLENGLERMEANLAATQEELAASMSEVQMLQYNLADTQAELGDATLVVQAVQDKLQYMTLVLEPVNGLSGPHIIFEGCNVHVRSGSGNSVDGTYNLNNEAIFEGVIPRGLGNLIVGYNEQPESEGLGRGGSHNLVVGPRHTYPTVCGAIFGQENQTTGPLSSVTGGSHNVAEGYASSVSGGTFNTASDNKASVSGGTANTASGYSSSVTGGYLNTASGGNSSVSGGYQRAVGANEDWQAGSLYEDY